MASKNSLDFVNSKKLIYVEKYEVDEVHIKMEQNDRGEQTHTATVKFCKENNCQTISSSEDDFVLLAWSLKKTVQNGVQKIIEVKDTNTYYDNLDYFIDATNIQVKSAIKEIVAGQSKLSKDFEIENVLSQVIENKFSSPQIKNLVESYFYVFANEILKLKKVQESFEIMKKNSASPTNFIELSNLAGKVYQDYLFVLPPLQSLEVYNKILRVDLDHVSKSLLHQEETSNARWAALTKNATQGVEGKTAAKYMMDDYSDYYEIVSKMLRQLAFVIFCQNPARLEDSQKGIELAITSVGYTKLLNPISRRLRNSDSHWDVDYSEKGKVKLIDSRSGKAKLLDELSYEDLIKNVASIREFSKILLVSLLLMEVLLYIRVLDSPDFKFKMIENYRSDPAK